MAHDGRGYLLVTVVLLDNSQTFFQCLVVQGIWLDVWSEPTFGDVAQGEGGLTYNNINLTKLLGVAVSAGGL